MRSAAVCFCLNVILLSSIFSADATPQWKPPHATQNAVLLVIDGPRWSETYGDEKHQYAPHLAADLAKVGSIWTAFKNNGPTLTVPGHIALTTGVYQQADNSGKDLPGQPSILQVFLKTTGLPASSAWLVTSKDKLEILKNCSDPEWNGKYQCSSDCGTGGLHSSYRADAKTFEQMKKVLAKDHPRLAVFHFKEPDSSGHARKWEKYLQGIRDTDRMAWELWQFLQQDPFYAGKTAFFISNDHGRHPDGVLNGFASHGDGCPGCRHILLFAAGPDFKQGELIAAPGEQIDVAVTISELLGMKLPSSKGRVLREMYRDGVLPAGEKKPEPRPAAVGKD